MLLEFKSVFTYGTERFYPINGPAMAICRVAGQKSLLIRQLQVLVDTGKFDVNLVGESLANKLSGVPA